MLFCKHDRYDVTIECEDVYDIEKIAESSFEVTFNSGESLLLGGECLVTYQKFKPYMCSDISSFKSALSKLNKSFALEDAEGIICIKPEEYVEQEAISICPHEYNILNLIRDGLLGTFEKEKTTPLSNFYSLVFGDDE